MRDRGKNSQPKNKMRDRGKTVNEEQNEGQG